MAVSTFFFKSLSDSPGFIHPAAVSLSPLRTCDSIIKHEMDLHCCCYMFVFRNARFVGSALFRHYISGSHRMCCPILDNRYIFMKE